MAPVVTPLAEWQSLRYGDSNETRAALAYWRERGWAVDDPNSVQADIRIQAFKAGYREAIRMQLCGLSDATDVL